MISDSTFPDCDCKLCIPAPKPVSKLRRGLIRARALANFSKRWKRQQVIYYHIGAGATHGEVRNIQRVAREVSTITGLKLIQTARTKADIRIGFKRGAGSWSTIGTDARHIPYEQDTMNFGWDVGDTGEGMKTVRHEFGHAIGLGHEHQNPNGGLVWDESKVVKDLSGPPNNWTLAQIKFNVLDYAKLTTLGWHATKFDPYSVMLYQFPDDWLLDGTRPPRYVPGAYSTVDKEMMAKMYGNDVAYRCGFWCRLMRIIFGY